MTYKHLFKAVAKNLNVEAVMNKMWVVQIIRINENAQARRLIKPLSSQLSIKFSGRLTLDQPICVSFLNKVKSSSRQLRVNPAHNF